MIYLSDKQRYEFINSALSWSFIVSMIIFVIFTALAVISLYVKFLYPVEVPTNIA